MITKIDSRLAFFGMRNRFKQKSLPPNQKIWCWPKSTETSKYILRVYIEQKNNLAKISTKYFYFNDLKWLISPGKTCFIKKTGGFWTGYCKHATKRYASVFSTFPKYKISLFKQQNELEKLCMRRNI